MIHVLYIAKYLFVADVYMCARTCIEVIPGKMQYNITLHNNLIVAEKQN